MAASARRAEAMSMLPTLASERAAWSPSGQTLRFAQGDNVAMLAFVEVPYLT